MNQGLIDGLRWWSRGNGGVGVGGAGDVRGYYGKRSKVVVGIFLVLVLVLMVMVVAVVVIMIMVVVFHELIKCS
jgi:hypothetical protein